MKKINGLINFVRRENGGVTAIFMIMLPMMLAFLALALDGSWIMMKKTRLADGLNEGALAIAAGASNGQTGDEAKNDALLRQYIHYYLPNDEIVVASVSTRQATGGTGPRAKDTIFDIKAEIKFNTILPMTELPSFTETMNMNNKGSVRKNISPGRPADYVFVVDFSGSMEDPSSEPGMTRIQLLKKVVKDITDRALKDQPKSTFGFVPFETGVPIKLEGKNDAGGDRLGCSALFVPRKYPQYGINYDINYAFWANKNIVKKPGNGLGKINEQLDLARYNFFAGAVLSSLNLKDITALTRPPYNYCVPNTNKYPGVSSNKVKYHCERDARSSIYTPENQRIIADEFDYAVKAYESARSYGDSIFNYDSISFIDTLEHMFDESKVISFEQHGLMISLDNADTPFGGMCSSRGSTYRYNASLQENKRNAYLIELTSDKEVIDEVQNMYPMGGTESTVGLLRAIPVLTKGQNARKVMIIISDGDDNFTGTRDAFHKSLHVCEEIRQRMPKYSPVTEDVSIYFISISASSADDERVRYWGQYCTGMGNSVIAANYSDLMTKLIEITTDAEETGFFNVE